jgi:phosphonate ABC transporter permease subunit PhnE
MQDKKQSPGGRFARTFLITVVVIVVVAYGFQVTHINLAEPKEERRQNQLVNVIRALARPDLVNYEAERVEVNTPILIPCPEGQFTLPEVSQPGPSLALSTECAEPESEITVTGSGFEAGDSVLIFFVPYKENPDEAVQLPLADKAVSVDSQGNFTYNVTLKKGRTSENPQMVRAVVNREIGFPRPTQTTYETIEKIIETIFLALIATALGTLLSIPISFLAARNLMIQVTSAYSSLMTLIVAASIGWFLGWQFFGLVGGWGTSLILGGESTTTAAVVGLPLALFLSVQALAGRGRRDDQLALARSYGLGILIALAAALVLGLVAGLGQRVGLGLINVLGPFAFLGNFLYVLSDALAVFMPLIGGLTGMFALISVGDVFADSVLRRAGTTVWGKLFAVVMSILAGATLFGLIAALLAWLYEASDWWNDVGLSAVVGGVLFGIAGLITKADRSMPTGIIIYYISRTILNVLRAIEPLIMAIVFVVWVGIGPFAGVLALTLHTIASLGKLYSEQVENIAQGPIEAIMATGANRLQTIIYAVIPQIIPPYIAFTIYRWDINVRMSTIIGFAGGGGIGFLLQQNLNLLKYSQASVQMLAIAIVVASLDYISAKIREQII